VLSGDGDDVITEDAGPLVGGYGTDTMGGQGGNDRLTTTGGLDRLVGDDGDDHLTGSPEADYLAGGGGADLVSAGDGDDIVLGGAGPDTFSVGTSLDPRDTVVDLAAETAVGYGTDVVESFENAVAQSNGGTDVLRGTVRDNVFSGLGAGDSVDGLLGTDTLDLTESIDAPTQRTGWRVDLGTGTAWLGTARVGLVSIENVNGSSGADVLLGSAGPNVLRGLGRADVLRGRGGDDVLVGGKGDDTVAGGAGRDRCTSPTRRQGATGCELP
jgi:Ca2+-binding RTX toxin-like protein